MVDRCPAKRPTEGLLAPNGPVESSATSGNSHRCSGEPLRTRARDVVHGFPTHG
mgnify:CR=1 FL=1